MSWIAQNITEYITTKSDKRKVKYIFFSVRFWFLRLWQIERLVILFCVCVSISPLILGFVSAQTVFVSFYSILCVFFFSGISFKLVFPSKRLRRWAFFFLWKMKQSKSIDFTIAMLISFIYFINVSLTKFFFLLISHYFIDRHSFFISLLCVFFCSYIWVK